MKYLSVADMAKKWNVSERFIIDEQHKMYYYRGLREWKSERGYLTGTCLSAQDKFKVRLSYFRIPYKDCLKQTCMRFLSLYAILSQDPYTLLFHR